MDRRRFSLISHGEMRFWNPLPVAELVAFLRELPLPRASEVLDYGCGPGEVSRELASWQGAHITGIDPNPNAIARCRAKVAGRFLEEEFQTGRFAPASFDLIVNIGASPGLRTLLEQVMPLLRRPGHLLMGDIYWRHPPSDELLAFLGESRARTPTTEEQRALLEQHGFRVERTLLATEADWDRYEDQYDANLRAYVQSHPDDPSSEAFESRRREWRAMYLKHARAAMGFALYQVRLGD